MHGFAVFQHVIDQILMYLSLERQALPSRVKTRACVKLLCISWLPF